MARRALLIAGDHYEDPAVPDLAAPARDAQELRRLLADPAVGGYDVQIAINETAARLRARVAAFFDERPDDDVLLLYFSGHAFADADGRLSFLAADTYAKDVATTGLPVDLLYDAMARTRAEAIVLLLDCSLPAGLEGRGGPLERRALETPLAVLVAAAGGGQAIESADPAESLFSAAIVGGIASGAADGNGDGTIDVDELYEYVVEYLREWGARSGVTQVPQRFLNNVTRPIPLARVPAAQSTPVGAPTVAVGSLGGANNDRVPAEDQLGFVHYVDAFCELITSRATEPPLTIGIFGSWGMGKSFLLEHIERRLSNRQDRDGPAAETSPPLTVYVVRFNAWEYSAAETVWPALVRKIVKTLDEEVRWPWRKRLWTRLRWNLARDLRRVRGVAVAAVIGIGFSLGVALWQSHQSFAAVAGAVAAVVSVASVAKAATNPVSRWVTSLFEASDYGGQMGYMEAIRHDLDQLERRLHDSGDSGKPVLARVLVLIDDLDRCEPEKVVEVLQAVNLLLNFNSFIVCMGIDARVVTRAVERHYEGVLTKAGASGYEYLDKIIQIPFRIPEPGETELRTFLGKQLGDPVPPAGSTPADTPDGDGVSAGDEDDAGVPMRDEAPAGGGDPAGHGPPPEPEDAAVPFTYDELVAFRELVPFLRPNPRHLKRLVNVYRLVRSLARIRYDTTIADNPKATIQLLLMSGQWPYRMREMLQQLEATKPGADGDDATGDPLLQLLNRAEERVSRAAFDRVEGSGALMRTMLERDGSGLSWEQLERIRRYTVNFNPAAEGHEFEPSPEGDAAEAAG
jgi:hypothetical protein